jgi:AraC-like DNA-binding protein/transcriptional regulator of met regulon
MSKLQPVKSEMIPQVRAVTLSAYVDVVQGLGVDPFALLRQAKIRPEELTDPETRLAAMTVTKLAEDTALLTGCPSLGLLLAEPRNFASLGPISLLLQHRANVREAFHSLAKHRRMISDIIDYVLDDDGETATLRAEVMHRCASRQTTEFTVAVMFRVLREMTEGRWRPESIHFRHSAPADLRIHRRTFAFPIQFDSDFDGISCQSASLDVANRTANDLMARHAEQCLEMLAGQRAQASVTDQVRRTINNLLSRTNVTMESVADNLSLHPRMLQRLLEKEGATFAGLLNEARRDLAVRYLSTSNHSVTDVGMLLGYSTLSSFSRWFTVEFGKSPASWRNAERGVPTVARGFDPQPANYASGSLACA